MRKFKFSLESLLDIRAMKEKQALMKVASVQSKINTHLMAIEKLHKEFEQSQKLYYQQCKKEFWVEGARMFNSYLQRLNDDEIFYQDKIQELQPRLKEAQKIYFKANSERKIVERLKEKKWEEYQYKLKKEMQRESDEINNNLFSLFEKKKKIGKKVETTLHRELEEQEKLDQLITEFQEHQKKIEQDAFMGYRGKK